MLSRSVEQSIEGKEQNDRFGNKVRGIIGRKERRSFDPFRLMIEFKATAPAGFPDRPKRGVETVTYVLDGKLRHEDCSKQGTTIVHPGDVQYMLAGKGIKHCDVPDDQNEVHGLQLWVDLPGKMMIEPNHDVMKNRPFLSNEKPDGVQVKIIAGKSLGHEATHFTDTPIMFLDFKLDKQAVLNQTIPEGWNAFIYILSGQATFGDGEAAKQYGAHCTLILDQIGQRIAVDNTSQQECRFLLIGGKPHGKTIKQFGPFVINDEEEMNGRGYIRL
ncbi:pirin-like [Mytilus californianus]|uniref:pirin-like n=1 Tax=Mytilus californianus TaxID=6549 RepID=UPI002245DA81|nr:pirin-like [Mytilus californianus]XP_052075849.1 pirin-like [Mytilus californianus]